MSQERLTSVLEATGFMRVGEKSPGLLDQEKVNATAALALRYKDVLGSSADLVYEIPSEVPGLAGTPTIYFKAFDHDPSDTEVAELRRLVWNGGRAPVLWLITPRAIQLHNCLHRPQRGESAQSQLLEQLENIAEVLRRSSHIHREAFDTGAFFASGIGTAIDRRQRVDRALLFDLETAQSLLTSAENGMVPLAPAIANALLGRAIFAAYLCDREIVTQAFLRKKFRATTLVELLHSKTATYEFFAWIRDTFNGHLFPVTEQERRLVRSAHLTIVASLIAGDSLQSYPHIQPRFWPYQFDVIPIELISSIYEKFSHAAAPELSEERAVHYTRAEMVDLVLDLAMHSAREDTTVLDPACGSGVFLVEAFRRLAWLRGRKLGRRPNRDELREILQKQIYGIDIDAEAVQVAAFSLYLALLELDPEPRPPSRLRLPLLLTADGAAQPSNLWIGDFCDSKHPFNASHPFAARAFDVIVGNPPWTSPPARKRVDSPFHPAAAQVEYAKKADIPDLKPDQTFMARARDFARPETTIAFIVGSRLFTQQSTIDVSKRWLTTFLAHNSLAIVVNLTDLVDERMLFGEQASTRLPAAVVVYKPNSPSADHSFTYITPRWYPRARERGDILISAPDIHILAQEAVKATPVIWKTALRGSVRDFRLIEQFQKLDSFDRFLDGQGITTGEGRARGVSFGSRPSVSVPELQGKPYLEAKQLREHWVDVDELPLFSGKVAARSNKRPFKLPVLVVSRSLVDGRPCTAVIEPSDSRTEVVVDQLYYCISLATKPRWLAYRLRALLTSDLALYAAFMLSPALGIDRRLLEVSDWLGVPVSATITERNNSNWRELERLARATDNGTGRISRIVEDIYDLSPQDRTVISDAIVYQIQPVVNRKRRGAVVSHPTREMLEAYTKQIQYQVEPLLRYSQLTLNTSAILVSSGLIACQLKAQPEGESSGFAWQQDDADLRELMDDISRRIGANVGSSFSVRRDLRVYDNDSIWIIKPAERRLWSRSAALLDADAIVQEHLQHVSNATQ